MENNFYNDEFEQLLKEKADSFRMYPSKRVWHSIYNDLHPGRRWPSIAMGLSLIIALIFIGYVNNNHTNSKTTVSKKDVENNSAFAVLAINGQNNNTQGFIDNQQQNITDNSNSAFNSQSTFSNLISRVHNGSLNDRFASSANSNGFDPYIVAILNKKNSYNATAKRRGHTDSRFTSAAEMIVTSTNGIAETADDHEPDIASERSVTKNTTVANSKNNNAVPDIDNSADDITTNATSKADIALLQKIADQKKENAKITAATEDKAWIENYAFYNNTPKKNRWKGRLDIEFYATPNVGYRKLTGGAVYDANPLTAPSVARGDVGNTVDHTPALGLEVGTAFNYALSKKLIVKAGLQFNYASYGIKVNQTYHPVSTSILMIDPVTGQEYASPRTSTLSNTPGSGSLTVLNTSYQISLPVGFAFKIAGNKKLSWFAGATIQPTYVFGGQTNLLSSDRRNYVSESAMIHNWNFNTGAETYLSYKMNGYSLQVGPQFRYQLMSTYDKKYVNSEKLYNAGLKIGIVKKL